MSNSEYAHEKICPVDETAKIIGNKWTPLIIRDLVGGVKRFNQLERSLEGISPKTLSERLRRLEAERIVARRCFAEVPPRVEYSLTPKGHALVPVIDSMRAYGLTWLCGSASASRGAMRAAQRPLDDVESLRDSER
jgi:DNA-binding HxlR family transcriptional regulator